MFAHCCTGSIDASTALVLANAVHFKSAWDKKFDDAVDAPFYLTPSNHVTVKMMSLRKDLYYYHDDTLKYAALELPYEVRIVCKLCYFVQYYENALIKLHNF